MAKNGNVILVGLEGRERNYIIGGARSCELTIDSDTIEISSAGSATAREFIAGRTTWTVTVNYLVSNPKAILSVGGTTLASILNVRNIYTLYFGERGSGTSASTISSNYVSGQAILKSVKITATKGNLIQGSIVFQGSSALS